MTITPEIQLILDNSALTDAEKNIELARLGVERSSAGGVIPADAARVKDIIELNAAETPVAPGTTSPWVMPNEFEPLDRGSIETAKDKYKKIAGGNSITGNYSLSEDPMSFMFGGTQDGITTKGAIPTAWSFGKSAWDIYASAQSAKELEKNRLAQLAATQQGIDNKNVDQRNKIRRQNQLAGYGLTSGNSHTNQALLYAKYRPEEYKKIDLMQYS